MIRALRGLHAGLDIAEHCVKVYPSMVLRPALLVGDWLLEKNNIVGSRNVHSKYLALEEDHYG